MSKSLNDIMQAIANAAGADEPEGCHEHDHKTLFKMMAADVPLFIEGDLLVWKCEQLRPSKLPLPGQYMAVVRKLPEPVYDREGGSGRAFFAMPLDLVVSAVDSRGDYIEFLVDSRRVTHA